MSISGAEQGQALKEALALRSPASLALGDSVHPVVIVDDTRWPPYRTARRRFAASVQINATAANTGHVGILCVPATNIDYVVVDAISVAIFTAGGDFYAVTLGYNYVTAGVDSAGDTDSRHRPVPPTQKSPIQLDYNNSLGAQGTDLVQLEAIVLPGTTYTQQSFTTCLPVVIRPGCILNVTPAGLQKVYVVNVGGWWDS